MVTVVEAKPEIKPKVNIVWKYSPELFSYLRQSCAYTCRTRGPLRGWSGRGSWVRSIEELLEIANSDKESRFLMIGYEEVGEKVAPGVWCRRYWWLKSYDRDLQPEGVYKTRRPAEAVNPLEVTV